MNQRELEQHEIERVEAALKSLSPAGCDLDRERLMYRAGEAAGRRGVRRWQGACAAISLAVAALLAAQGMLGPGVERGGVEMAAVDQRPSHRAAEPSSHQATDAPKQSHPIHHGWHGQAQSAQLARASGGRRNAERSRPASSAVLEPPEGEHAAMPPSYLRLRRLVLTQGVEALARVQHHPTSIQPVGDADRRPLRAGDWRRVLKYGGAS